MPETPIVIVQQNGSRYLDANKLGHFSYLFSFDIYLLDSLYKVTVFSVKAYFDSLLSKDLICILAGSLTQLKARKLALVGFILSANFVKTLCLEPVFAPLSEIKGFKRI